MKGFARIIIVLMVCQMFFSCEKVIDIDLEEGEKQLVIDANIDLVQGAKVQEQRVILSKTSGYFSNDYPKVSGATVSVSDGLKNVYSFEEEQPGVYICHDFKATHGEVYSLQVLSDGVEYTSQDTIREPVEIYKVLQKNDGGIYNDEIEVQVFFTTQQHLTPQYFMVITQDSDNKIPFFLLLDGNDFKDGKYFFVGSSEDWESGHELHFRIYNISKRYFEYMTRLLAVSNRYMGKPLTTPPARVQGNVVNVADKSKNPLGAFRVSSCLKYTLVLK